jgi:hypothetical protein
LVTDKLEDIHVKLIKAFHYDNTVVDPTEVATHDEEYHVIESIEGHKFKGPKAHRKSLQFLIKWDSDPKATWQSWSLNLAKNKMVINYLKTQNMKRFISNKYSTDSTTEQG